MHQTRNYIKCYFKLPVSLYNNIANHFITFALSVPLDKDWQEGIRNRGFLKIWEIIRFSHRFGSEFALFLCFTSVKILLYVLDVNKMGFSLIPLPRSIYTVLQKSYNTCSSSSVSSKDPTFAYVLNVCTPNE